MTLPELAQLLGCEAALPDLEVLQVTEDSRRVRPGAVFFATRGEKVDGHDYAGDAVAAGAIAVAGDQPGIDRMQDVPYLYVAAPHKAVARAAHRLMGDPSKQLTVIGITGTNGKSSSVLLTQHILGQAGHRPAAFGTLGYQIGESTLPAPHTTPFGEDLAHLFHEALRTGRTHVVMEASSHALEQGRVAGIDFDVAAFTNLTQDHLDYHESMEQYRDAKLKLFESLEGDDKFTVVNRDDPNAGVFEKVSKVRCYTYGKSGEVCADHVQMAVNEMQFDVTSPWGSAKMTTKLLGNHNVSNILGVVTICGALGISLENIAAAIASMAHVPGRFEHVDEGQSFQVIVDYAHTEDGLRNVLTAAREICQGRLIALFGCGGDRDRGKRPKMAKVAAALSDYAILASDNPRTEDPERILLDIEVGMQQACKRKEDDYLVILDRAEAIRQALGMAKEGDLVMIAGKGHEDYQILGTERIHFDDREVAREVLRSLRYSTDS